MWIKNGRIIINENSLESEIKRLEKGLRNFFENDPRFSMDDIAVFVEFDNECWNDETNHIWNELNIQITNYSKEIELDGQMAGEKRFGFACITYTTENYEPHLVINDGVPEFYYVFDGASWTITDSNTWGNTRDGITIEDIIQDEVLSKWEIY